MDFPIGPGFFQVLNKKPVWYSTPMQPCKYLSMRSLVSGMPGHDKRGADPGEAWAKHASKSRRAKGWILVKNLERGLIGKSIENRFHIEIVKFGCLRVKIWTETDRMV